MIDLNAAYRDRLASGHIHPDPAQVAALNLLQSFAHSIQGYKPPHKRGLMSRLLKPPKPLPHGLYIYGSVGRGKSMLMDLFFDQAPIVRKRRVHFHQFMLEVHERLHRLQQNESPELLPRLAKEIAAETWLLCFDEFHVSNIADAMILGRLFEALFARGVIIVATSNWHPSELYKNGLQRDRFLPFIALLQERMQVYFLDGAVDHRFEHTQGIPCYYAPLSPQNSAQLKTAFKELTDGATAELVNLPVQGRILRLPHVAKGVGLFTFDDLCVQPLGSADFLALAENLHTVLLDKVPRMTEEKRNETTRFINMIDALYEAKVKLYMAAEAPPSELAPQGELQFPFQRTVSRLMEMQGEDYKKKAHLSV